MVDFVTYIVDKNFVERPNIMVSDALEKIDDTVVFTYHLGELPGVNVGIVLTLQYSDVDSKAELLSIILIDLPSWLVECIEDGKTVSINDVAKNISIELTPEAREIAIGLTHETMNFRSGYAPRL